MSRKAPAPIKAGTPASVVRWSVGRDGWEHNIVDGSFYSQDERRVVLLVEGTLVTFDRDGWELCIP